MRADREQHTPARVLRVDLSRCQTSASNDPMDSLMTIDPRRLAGMWRWLNSDGLDGPIALTVSSPLSVDEAAAALRANLSSRPPQPRASLA